MSEKTQSNAGLFALGGLAAVVMGVAVFIFLPAPEPRIETPQVQPAVIAEPTLQDPPIEAIATQAAPQFDTLRVERDGSMVIAGRAAPGQIVDIILSDSVLERVTADSSGSFVALPVAGPSDRPRRLSLVADPDGAAISSETSYMVAPIAAPQVAAVAEPAITETDGLTAPATEAAPTALLPDEPTVTADATLAPPTAPSLPSTEVPIITPAQEPATPTVLQADATGIRVIQTAPQLATPQANDNVALDAITYDPQGEVQLSGRATGEGSVQVYLDNEPLTTSPITDQGDFRIDLPDVDTGVYTLRIDEVDVEGDVVSRIETPFKREEAEDVAAVLAEETSRDGFEVAVKTVQPGATLWAIAEENLGNGIFYVEVFEANADLIRDPDLIYPGQIFRIPDMNQ